ncbi:VIR protein [Plasmodium vivax]|uniref:VIR protein n=1 Tax=Plasmodium vivax TaxID=5855 RepID=A0A1G4H9B4_PLAVI|nr:VIR protein [Plasmodium vivax]
MADEIVEKALESLKKEDTFRTKDELHLLYQKFEENDLHDSPEICIKETGLNIISEGDDKIVELCSKVESILKKFNSLCSTKNGPSGNNCCDYLIYWIYGELIEGKYTPYSVHWLYRKIQELLEKYQRDTNTNPKCNEYFTRVFSIENLKNKKYLHDFLVYFNYIKGILESETPHKKDYCDYIYYILQLYNNIKESCYSRIPEACPDEIKLFQDKIRGNELSLVKNKCYHIFQEFKLSNWDAILDQLQKEQTMHVERVKKPFKYSKLINYDIFHYLKIYQEAEPSDQDKKKNVPNEIKQCTKINSDNHGDPTKLKLICEDFIIYLFKLSKTKINSIHYLDYLNYWLNKKLKEIKINATKFIGIIDNILSYNFSSNSLYNHFKHSVYDMNDKNFKEMNILYDLYDNYNKFLNISKTKFRRYNNECLNKYITGINKCYHTENKRFYKALKKFLSIFDGKNLENCEDQSKIELFSLCEILQRHENDIIQQNCTSSCETIKNTNFKTSKGVYDHEQVLNILTAHEKYEKLDNQAVEESTCSKYCEDFIFMDDKHEDFNLLCAKMATNLKKLKSVLEDVPSPDDRCTYLIFWAYEKIMNILNKNPSNRSNYYAINLLNQVLYTVNKDLSSSEKCSYNFDGALSDWEKEKYLHDYFKNFEKLDKNIGKNSSDCKTYLEYLKLISELYMKDLKSCCSRYTNSDQPYLGVCPKYFKCEKKYFPHSLISRLNCGNENTDINVDKIFNDLIVDHDVVMLTRMSNPTASNYSLNGSLQNLVSHLMGDRFNSAMFYSYSFLGISFLFFLLYKVTNRKSKSSKISHQMDIAMSDMQMQYEENPPLERKKPPLERKKPPLERKKPPLERKKPPLERKPPPKKKSPRNERIRIAYASNN